MNGGWSIRKISTRQLVEELSRRQDVDVRKKKPGGKPITIEVEEGYPCQRPV